MATELIDRPIARLNRTHVSWGALFAGLFSGLGFFFLLLLLGAAIGLSSFNPREASSWGNLGQGFGIWGGIAAILASFLGAFVCSRLSNSGDRADGAFHGIALWGLSTALGLYALFAVVSGVVGTATSVAGGAASAVGSTVGMGAAALSPDALARQANQVLRSQGRPEVPPEQMKAAIDDIERQALQRVRAGQPALDHETVVASISRQTNLSRQDAESVAGQVESGVQQATGAVKSGASTLGRKAQNVGLAAVSGARSSAWWAFIGLALMLGSSMLGGAAAIPRRERLPHDRFPRERTVVREPEVQRGPTPPLTPRHV